MLRGRPISILVLVVIASLSTPTFASAAATTDAAIAHGLATGTAASVTLVGAGDIASCTSNRDAATAALVRQVLDADSTAIAFTAGDNVYPNGSLTYFNQCYGPTWGAFKSRTRPGIGNHEFYNNPGAAGYFEYFGASAGPAGRGWYKFYAGTWRVYMLTSECSAASACYRRQVRWLKNDLANNPRQCVLAVWHRPLFSTGEHGNSPRMRKIFDILYKAGAELVVNGHDHGYQRFKPADAWGVRDSTNGIREIVAATGGASLYAFETQSALLAVRDNSSHGVLKLTLGDGSYSWEFIPVAGDSFTDRGTAGCH